MNLVRGYGLHTLVFNWSASNSFDQFGRQISDKAETDAEKVVSKLLSDASKFADTLSSDISLGDALQHVITTQKLVLTAYARALLYAFLQDEFGLESAQLSAWWYDATGPWVERDAVIVEGFGSLVNEHVKGISNILLNVLVTGIDYSTPAGVTVTTASGATFQASKVVVTVPLGVLQKNIIPFKPSLPAAKSTALSLMKMGVLDHVFLRFPAGTLSGLSPPTYDVFSKVPSNSSSNGHGFVEIVSLLRMRKQDILMAEASGAFAVAMETQSDGVVVAAVMKELRMIYPTMPSPIATKVTRWSQDPFAYGSYSSLGVGALGYGSGRTPTADVLAQAIGNRIFFSGEHTSSAYPSSVQGAYESGLREANKILALP